MLSYKPLTLRQFIEAIILQMERYKLPYNYDYVTLIYQINLSIVEAVNLTYPFYSNHFITRLYVTHGTRLPNAFIKPVSLYVKYPNFSEEWYEARYVAPEEFGRVTNWNEFNVWARGIGINPVFTVFGDVVAAGQPSVSLCVYVYPNNENSIYVGNPKEDVSSLYEGLQGRLECYAYPLVEPKNLDAILMIPYEVLHLVELLTMSKELSRLGLTEPLGELLQKIATYIDEISGLKDVEKTVKQREIDAFVEPAPPFVPPQTGDVVPKNLIGG